jgi:hypothetical protein
MGWLRMIVPRNVVQLLKLSFLVHRPSFAYSSLTVNIDDAHAVSASTF